MSLSIDFAPVVDVLARFPNVLAAWVFGSAQEGAVRPGSDIDIGVLFEQPPDLDEMADLRADLQDALHFDDIDLVVLNGMHSILRFETVTGKRLFCRDDENVAGFVSLTAREYAEMISVGGALGLLHYLDYRPTRDIDAWWGENVTREQQQAVIDSVVQALSAEGDVQIRRWGDVTSVELAQESCKVFSFRVARRSAQLEPSGKLPWVDVPLDSFADLVASKMVALVERGAPRDFRDIYALNQAGLVTSDDCWRLWRQRQELSSSDTDFRRAYLAILTHLERIVQHRPLDRIADTQARKDAARLRSWFRDVFVGELT